VEIASVPGDPEIRRALLAYLSSRTPTPVPAVIEELGLCQGQVRADVVVVGNVLYAYEIKSDRDNLSRLARQAEIYGQTMFQHDSHTNCELPFLSRQTRHYKSGVVAVHRAAA
jgi:hypothetical protein